MWKVVPCILIYLQASFQVLNIHCLIWTPKTSNTHWVNTWVVRWLTPKCDLKSYDKTIKHFIPLSLYDPFIDNIECPVVSPWSPIIWLKYSSLFVGCLIPFCIIDRLKQQESIQIPYCFNPHMHSNPDLKWNIEDYALITITVLYSFMTIIKQSNFMTLFKILVRENKSVIFIFSL